MKFIATKDAQHPKKLKVGEYYKALPGLDVPEGTIARLKSIQPSEFIPRNFEAVLIFFEKNEKTGMDEPQWLTLRGTMESIRCSLLICESPN